MYKLPIQRYRRLRHLLPFELLAEQFYGVLLLACTTPLLVLSGIAIFADRTYTMQFVLGAVGLASVVTLLLAIWITHAILAPVSLARRALYAYHREHRVLALPEDLEGEAGGLLKDVRATLELCERQRLVFAEQADWAFRGKRSPLLASNGAPRRLASAAMVARSQSHY